MILSDSLLLVSIGWPLLIGLAWLVPKGRAMAIKLTPWAAMPALLLWFCADTMIELPGIMLDSVLVLDSVTRVFLLLNALLWLATGQLIKGRLATADGNGMPVLLLLAMAGSFCLVLAGDGVLFLMAVNLTGYSLYGVMVFEATRSIRHAGRILVIILVVSDLLILEALLLLSQGVGRVDFASLQQALLNTDSQGLVLAFLIIGLGAKWGLLGVHLWIPLVFNKTPSMLMPALIAFMLSAGLLGLWRFIPLQQLHNPVAGELLQWLAWITLIYVALVGFCQRHGRAMLGYAAVGLGSVWLMVLGIGLQNPLLWSDLVMPSATFLTQSSTSLVALLILNANKSRLFYSDHNILGWCLASLASLLLAMAPQGVVWVMPTTFSAVTLLFAMGVLALLAAGSFLRKVPSLDHAPPPTHLFTVAAGLIGVALLSAGYQFYQLTLSQAAISLSLVVGVMLLTTLNARWQLVALPSLPGGDILLPMSQCVYWAKKSLQRLHHHAKTHWATGLQSLKILLHPLRHGGNRLINQLGVQLLAWPIAMALLLLLILVFGGLAVS